MLSLYQVDEPFAESGEGRFHGSLTIGADRLRQLGDWIDTRRADFDQQQVGACGPAADTLPFSPGLVPATLSPSLFVGPVVFGLLGRSGVSSSSRQSGTTHYEPTLSDFRQAMLAREVGQGEPGRK